MELTLTDVPVPGELLTAHVEPLIRVLRPALDADGFARFAAEAAGQGLVFTAALDPAGRCLGVAAHRVLATSRGRVLFVDDLVTSPAARSTGVGARLLAALAERGRAAGCVRIELDSGVQNHGAHRFYHARRMAVAAFHFTLDLHPERP
ncbi:MULTISPECIES: GNAT family N-acetyltransferase [Kitasatospora]|uniref:Putative acetyltransferase n=1 Tax=Kitasatospora setae (strain ATCC 33774 / DSM 43861 / JCM 3304 / KCC A-0304 / NBRC 14216 / KM-6054) TaxID=452652 RepID=E4N0J0_KITSK|nr:MULTISPECIES: GNAT family N-acetyltransferase [Kitasatospora]BAJ31674.1 putative acetyltransferase [Kitasatospora setae KM-6054]